MREIKFRGKAIESYGNGIKNGDWLYGDLLQEDNHEHHYILHYNKYYRDGKAKMSTPIDNRTISQYTGLKDINENEIYEGDILKRKCPNFNSKEKETVIYLSQVYFSSTTNPAGWRIKNPTKTGGWSSPLSWNKIYNNEAVVVGNIHDNPELLIK